MEYLDDLIMDLDDYCEYLHSEDKSTQLRYGRQALKTLEQIVVILEENA